MSGSGGKVVRVGRVISGLVSLAFRMSAFTKLNGGGEVTEGMATWGRRNPSESSSGSVSTSARAA